MDKEQHEQLRNRANWEEARPKVLPRPTYWPFFLAMGLAFLGWGIKAGWIVAGAGFVVFIIALTGWITDLRHESGKPRNDRPKSVAHR